MASGGEAVSGSLSSQMEVGEPKPRLLQWHASIAKNAAAEFAIETALSKGTDMRDIFLCNLDGDNMMLPGFPASAMVKASYCLSCAYFLLTFHTHNQTMDMFTHYMF